MSGYITINDPDSELAVVEVPIYDGPAADAHTELKPGEYITTLGLTLLVTDTDSKVLAPRRFISLDSGHYAVTDPTWIDDSWCNLGYTPSGDWADFAPIEADAVGDHEADWLNAIAAALHAAIAADAAYAAIRF